MRPKHRPPTSRGEMLLEEFLVPMEMTQSALAEELGLSVQSVNLITKGKRGITAETAGRLGAPRAMVSRQVTAESVEVRKPKPRIVSFRVDEVRWKPCDPRLDGARSSRPGCRRACDLSALTIESCPLSAVWVTPSQAVAATSAAKKILEEALACPDVLIVAACSLPAFVRVDVEAG